jgi:hypothetical protein
VGAAVQKVCGVPGVVFRETGLWPERNHRRLAGPNLVDGPGRAIASDRVAVGFSLFSHGGNMTDWRAWAKGIAKRAERLKGGVGTIDRGMPGMGGMKLSDKSTALPDVATAGEPCAERNPQGGLVCKQHDLDGRDLFLSRSEAVELVSRHRNSCGLGDRVRKPPKANNPPRPALTREP